MRWWRQVGRNLAVDLANSGRPTDVLGDDWLRRVGGPDQVDEDALRGLRSRIEALLDARVAGRSLPGDDVAAVNRVAAAAPMVAQLEDGELVFRAAASPDEAFRAEIAAAAIELVGRPRPRLRRCAAGCGRFLVATRGLDRWCSAACGTRERVARHRLNAR